MKISLVAMPWHALDMPSIPIGALSSHLKKMIPSVDVSHVYGTTHWAQFLMSESMGMIGLDDYATVANLGVYDGIGEWVFTSALYPGDQWPLEAFSKACDEYVFDSYSKLLDMWSFAPEFIDWLATHILESEPTLVGLSSTYSQNVASLALARALKSKRPDLCVVMGGANCDGVMGPALLRNFESLDAVCVGEGEDVLVELVHALQAQDGKISNLTDIAGLCWRSPNGDIVVNAPRPARFALSTAPLPDFTPYFDDLASRDWNRRVKKRLPYEASRGCWWGEKKHCTFCGLNGSSMDFRSRDGHLVFAQIQELCEKHGTSDVYFVDNILDLHYFSSLIPDLIQAANKLNLFFEVKSNLKERHVALLAKARIAEVQPGIESLCTDVLHLMRKGVDAAQNVIFLRSAKEYGVGCVWNWLYGFPGETELQYERVLPQLANLCHLQPPSITRITLQRFSPHFDDVELGFRIRRPAPIYDYLYKLPAGEIEDLAFFHQTPDMGLSGPVEDDLQMAIALWEQVYETSTLQMFDEDGQLTVEDRRALRATAEYVFSGWQRDVMLVARAGRSLDRLVSEIALRGYNVDKEIVRTFVYKLLEAGLLFRDERDDGSETRYVALAVAAAPNLTDVSPNFSITST